MSTLRSKRSVCELAMAPQEALDDDHQQGGQEVSARSSSDVNTPYSRKRRATPPLVLQPGTGQTAYRDSRQSSSDMAAESSTCSSTTLSSSSSSLQLPSSSSSSSFPSSCSSAPPAANPPSIGAAASNPLMAASSALPPTSFASRRHNKNNKQLFLVVPSSSTTSKSEGTAGRIPLTPTTSEHQLDISETKSCPPTPRLVLDTDANQPAVDPSKAETLKSALRGDMTMKRRTSLPRLNIKANLRLDTGKSTSDGELPPPTPSLSQCPATANITMVSLVGRNKEAGAPVESESPEDFPYQNGPREILPNLFLGSEHNAKDLETLRRHNITTVICVAKEVACPWQSDETIEESDETDEGTDSFGSDSDQEEKDREQQSRRNGTFLIPPSINTPCHPSAANSRSASPLLVRSTASTPNLQQRFQQGAFASSSVQKPPSRTPSYTSQPRTVSSGHPGVFHHRFTQSRLLGRPALQYTKLPWGHDEDNIASQFTSHQICEMVDKARANGGNCLVHCQLGVSRSATLMIGYCMRQASLGSEPALSEIKTMHDSYTYVRGKSRWVAPNIGLLAQLVQYERILQSASSAQEGLPYTNSAYYDSQASLYSGKATPTPDNLSPSSTTASSESKDSSLGTPDPATSTRQYNLSTPPKFKHSGESSFDEQLSPMTAAIRITKYPEYPSASEVSV